MELVHRIHRPFRISFDDSVHCEWSVDGITLNFFHPLKWLSIDCEIQSSGYFWVEQFQEIQVELNDRSVCEFIEVIERNRQPPGVFSFSTNFEFFFYFSPEFSIKLNECGLCMSKFTKRITTPWNVSKKEIGIEKRECRRWAFLEICWLFQRPLRFSWFIFYSLIHLWDS